MLKENDRRVMLVAVTYPAGKPDPVVILTLPLGILLPPGIALTIDGGKARRYQVDRCLTSGCKAAFVLDPELLVRFKAGIRADVTIQDGNRAPVTLPVSLVGFTAALRSLH